MKLHKVTYTKSIVEFWEDDSGTTRFRRVGCLELSREVLGRASFDYVHEWADLPAKWVARRNVNFLFLWSRDCQELGLPEGTCVWAHG